MTRRTGGQGADVARASAPPAADPAAASTAARWRDVEHECRLHALRRLLAAGAPLRRVAVVQTHLSSLLFAGDRVYKLKRPRDLGFVDFTTLARRLAACRAEWRLNRRTAPEHYLAVRPLQCQGDATLPEATRDRSEGGPRATSEGDEPVRLGAPVMGAVDPVQPVRLERPERTGGAGAGWTTVDWVLEMRRFDTDQGLDRLARQGRLTLAQVEALAEAVVALHAGLKPSTPARCTGAAPQRVRAMVARNLQELQAVAPAAWSARLARLGQWQRACGVALAPAMAARVRSGHVREGHGDLHLGNVAWWWPTHPVGGRPAGGRIAALRAVDGQIGAPLIFDALEFDPALRHTDTVADWGFTFMDLLARARPPLAWAFLNRVMAAGADADALRLLPYWTAHRALVRAKVAWLSAGTEDREPLARLARRYLTVAERAARWQPQARAAGRATSRPSCAGGPSLPHADRPGLIVTMGVSGSGKSEAARGVARALGAVVWRSDVERKRLFGLAERDRPEAGSPVYSRRANTRTYARLRRLAQATLSAGFHTVVDAASLRADERCALLAMADAGGWPAGILWCDADPGVLRRRVAARARADRDASDATVAVLAQQWQRLEPPGPDEQARLTRIDTGGTLADTRRAAVQAARRWLQRPR